MPTNPCSADESQLLLLASELEIAMLMIQVRDGGAADMFGGFYEWAASMGYSRQQVDRRLHLYGRVSPLQECV